MDVANSTLQDFLQQQKHTIEELLTKLLPAPQAHNKLEAAMHYSVLNNGKRLRPALVYATGQALNAPRDRLHGAALAVELIHCYSLIHDDLPAMDNDDLRRGLPTCHKAFDEATAILAGDALQTLAFQVLADPELNPLDPKLQIAMIAVLTKASGADGMILGQAEDMAAEHKLISLDHLIQVHQRKTGALFNACIELSLIASGNNNNSLLRESLLDYGANIGLAFQIRDDILDVASNTATLGKTVGSDAEAGKSTFTSLLGLDGAREYATASLQKALLALKPLGAAGELLGDLASYLLNRNC